MTEAYSASGVDVASADRLRERLGTHARSTWTVAVAGPAGYFSSAVELGGDRLLVATCDGLGTKTMLARSPQEWRGLGRDLVNHGVDDVICAGAEPLAFLDYLAQGELVADRVEALVEGIALACRAAGCALVGGETAQLPGIYREDAIDVAGTMIGMVDARARLHPGRVREGDLLVGWASSGLHTNGYSLARRVLGDSLEERIGDQTVRQALLAEHRSYLQPLRTLRSAAPGAVRSAAHLTGGGWPGNLPRALPPQLSAQVELGSWPRPPLFTLLAERSGLAESELAQVVNLGVGLVVVVAAEAADQALAALPGESWVVGRVVPIQAGGGRFSWS